MSVYLESRPICTWDIECLPGYFSVGFRSYEDNRQRIFEMYEGCPLDRKGIAKIVRTWLLVGFNSIKYDLPMLLYSMSGASNDDLVAASNELIQYGTPPWKFMERMGLTVPEFLNHIDLMSVSPGAPQMPSLKMLGGRLHSKKMQEMPVAHTEFITDLLRTVVRGYHSNDLITTADLLRDLKPQVDLRTVMSAEYKVDLRSKSDAQIAEAVIKAEIERLTGRRIYAPEIQEGSFLYKPPEFIQFTTPYMQGVLEIVKKARFYVDSTGVVHLPDELKGLRISIGDSQYQMGIGGIHSTESQVTHRTDKDGELKDRDVRGYYPEIIRRLRLYPKHIGPKFLEVYSAIIERRIKAKQAGDKNTAETLKIVSNGSFGKFGSPYSVLYSPNLMIQTTVTGQLALLMLIEQVERFGMRVVSANTDGFVTKVPRSKKGDFEAIITDWEWATGLTTEETTYLALHSRDVNNYIAVKRDEKTGKVSAKRKGTYAECGPGLPGAAGQKKNPDMEIANDAAVAFLTHGTPIEKTVRECKDIRKFVTVRRVTGGAEQEGEYVGKTIRWYYATGNREPLKYVKNGNVVPASRGAKPCMELPDSFPSDVDHDHYIREAYAILQDVGLEGIDPSLRGRSDVFMARKEKQKTLHLVDAKTGAALCGAERESVREQWIEYRELPDGHRLCSKCKKANEL